MREMFKRLALIRLNQLLTLVFFLPLCVLAQENKKPTKVELLHANTLEYDERIAPQTRRLIGDVKFKHDDAIMDCDSAYMYSITNSLDAFGNVHVLQADTVNMWGDVLNYDGNTKIAIVTGNVILDDGKMRLTTDRLVYDMNKKLGRYTTGGKIVDSENTLTSKIGYYYEDRNEFFFKDSVVLVNPKYTIRCDTLMYNTNTETAYFLGPTRIDSDENFIYCENGWYNTITDQSQFNKHAYIDSKDQNIRGDSLFYDRANGYGKAIDNVKVVDNEQDLVIHGDFAEYYEKKEVTLVTGHALMKQKFDRDTLYLHADTLRTELDTNLVTTSVDTAKTVNDTLAIMESATEIGGEIHTPIIAKDTIAAENEDKRRILYAYHKVKFYREDMQGMCDSLVYSFADSTIRLYETPILWSDSNQITADTINILISNNKVKQMEMINTSFIVSREDSMHYNQIKGKRMIGHFRDDRLRKVDVFGNGQTIYYVSEEKSDKVESVNKAESSDLTIYVDSNKVSNIIFFKQPEATLFPIQDVKPTDMILKNFAWHGNHRPMKIEDIFIWEAIEVKETEIGSKKKGIKSTTSPQQKP